MFYFSSLTVYRPSNNGSSTFLIIMSEPAPLGFDPRITGEDDARGTLEVQGLVIWLKKLSPFKARLDELIQKKNSPQVRQK